MHQFDWKKYIIVFFITIGLFATALLLSSWLGGKKLETLADIQDEIAIDLLSSETQFALLEELSCRDVDNSILSDELNSLASKIQYSESNIGESAQLSRLKDYYFLLEIKDYLLMKKVSERCGMESVFALYFYGGAENCPLCERQGYALTALREKYPKLRVYSFDYASNLSAVKAMISIYKVDGELPALVVNGEVLEGFQSVEDIEKAFPELEDIKEEEPSEADASDE